MNDWTIIAAAIAGGGAVFFLMQAWITTSTRKRGGRLAQAYAVLEEESIAESQVSALDRVRFALARKGYTGTLGPIALSLSLIYVLSALALTLKVAPIIALVLAAPVSAGVVWMFSQRITAKRKLAFDRQLLNALNQLAGIVEAGIGVQRGLEQVALSQPDPLHTELLVAVQRAQVTRDLIGALADLGERYPSRAYNLFLAALEIDQDLGAPAAPALKQAAATLQRDFDLWEEANAEIAQSKMEYYAILALTVAIVLGVIAQQPETLGMFTSGAGLVFALLGLANAAFGVFRCQSLFRSVSEDKTSRPMRQRDGQATLGGESA